MEIERWEQAYASAVAGNMEEIPKDMLVRFYKTWQTIHTDKGEICENLTNEPGAPKVNFWFYGDTGT